MSELYVGLMSGTSMDGVDGVLVDFSMAKPRVLQHSSIQFGEPLRAELLALNSSGPDELHRSALAANGLVRLYARVVLELLKVSATPHSDVLAIGAHGQTVRHQPQSFDGCGYTLQINAPSLLVELTGINVVADFRSRDVAAGGQGAPLVPGFHLEMFGQPGKTVAVLNIGGISNLSVLPAHEPHHPTPPILGFDCGPGNALMDHWCHQHTGKAFDASGLWAASGQVIPDLLEDLAKEAFFAQAPPKSTGRDLFNAQWLQARLKSFRNHPAQDIQATLTDLTAMTCADAVRKFAPSCEALIVCGGGALNEHLMRLLQRRLPLVRVQSSDTQGIPAQQVEAAAFAWLARKTLRRETGNLCSVTGARSECILGAVHLA